ncbi:MULTISPECIES: hypothetical protein [unclassified Rhizobium]|uniref:hypothetical protein n=1 Tax=unclassified Rhizobium TaxID=2613769 RepID=UPI001446366B|nr:MULTISPECIES: hypothetical protein [unclassified Rhizobium]NKJ07902.1 hypothetical protein [Rhizobium sp. SG741]NKJ36856.1 hypothetical protein [Rhizobium sp. SG570]
MLPLDEYLKLSPRRAASRLRRLQKPPYDFDDGNDRYSDAARYWGERLSLPDLYETYDDIFQGRHAVVQKQLFDLAGSGSSVDDACVPKLRTYLSALKEKYPVIAEIKVSNKGQAWAVVLGCVSKYSPSDVRYFLGGTYSREAFKERLRLLRVQECIGHCLEWRVGPESLAMLETHLSLEPFPNEIAGS